MSKSLVLEPTYIYISPGEVMEMFNNIENKVLHNQLLTYKEELEFIIIPIFLPNNKKEDITSRLCHIFKEYSSVMDYTLSLKISFVLCIMIDRNIENQKKKENLRKVIEMEQKIDALQEVIIEERQKDQKELRKANTEIKNLKLKSKENENILQQKDTQLQENKNLLQQKDEELKKQNSILDNIREITSKSKEVPTELLITILNSK